MSGKISLYSKFASIIICFVLIVRAKEAYTHQIHFRGVKRLPRVNSQVCFKSSHSLHVKKMSLQNPQNVLLCVSSTDLSDRNTFRKKKEPNRIFLYLLLNGKKEIKFMLNENYLMLHK